MQLVDVKDPAFAGARPVRPGWVAEWRTKFEQSAHAPTWLAAHKWNVDLRMMQTVAQDIREKIGLRSDDRVLEVGCGTGAFLSLVLHPNQKGFGFDLCEVAQGPAGDGWDANVGMRLLYKLIGWALKSRQAA